MQRLARRIRLIGRPHGLGVARRRIARPEGDRPFVVAGAKVGIPDAGNVTVPAASVGDGAEALDDVAPARCAALVSFAPRAWASPQPSSQSAPAPITAHSIEIRAKRVDMCRHRNV
jgi:hypothetical protein